MIISFIRYKLKKENCEKVIIIYIYFDFVTSANPGLRSPLIFVNIFSKERGLQKREGQIESKSVIERPAQVRAWGEVIFATGIKINFTGNERTFKRIFSLAYFIQQGNVERSRYDTVCLR